MENLTLQTNELKEYYANMEASEWPRYFKQYDRSSTDDTGTVVTYSNPVEEMFQMFKARLKDESAVRLSVR